MKSILKLILAALFIWGCSNDEGLFSPGTDNFINEIDFTKTYGGSKNDDAKSIINTADGGYAILGSTQSMDGDVNDKNNESFDYWLLKFDDKDSLEWSKTYGGSQDDHGFDIVQTADGGFAILGYSQSSDGDISANAGMSDYWVAKVDAEGTLQWEKSFGYIGGDAGMILTQTNDGGFLLTGLLDAFASQGQGDTKLHPGGNYWMIKLDGAGNKQWSRHYGGFFTDTAYGAVQTEDNGYIIVGSSDSYEADLYFNNKGTYDFWVIKISSAGDLVWYKNYGGAGIDEARAITDSGDGNYIIVGDARSSDQDVSENKGSADLWMIKINPSGDILWEKVFGGSGFDTARSVIRTADNGFLISGSTKSSDGDVTQNHGLNDAWVIKTNSDGQMLWQKSVGGSALDFAYDAIQRPDNTILSVGQTDSNDGDISGNKGLTDLLIIKLK